jgi:hypothetical protein
MSQTPRRAVAGGGGALAGKSALITGGQRHPIVPAGGRQRSAHVAPSSLAAAPDSAANWVKVNGRYNYQGPETSAEGKR